MYIYIIYVYIRPYIQTVLYIHTDDALHHISVLTLCMYIGSRRGGHILLVFFFGAEEVTSKTRRRKREKKEKSSLHHPTPHFRAFQTPCN